MTQPTPTAPEQQAPQDTAEPGTQEIAVAPAGSTATGTQQLPRVDAAPLPGGVQPTGPVGSLPGLPGLPAAGAVPGADTSEHPLGLPFTAGKSSRPPRPPRAPRSAEERAVLLGTGLAGLSFLLLQLGLTLGFGETRLWSTVTLWSLFATLAALLGALPFAGRLVPAARLRPDAAWQAAAGGLTGGAVFWVLVVLPRVDSDRGFVLTAALATLGAALWIAPGRSRG